MLKYSCINFKFFPQSLLSICLACLCVLASSCSRYGDPAPPKPPPDYPIDEFIFSTYLFEPGTWWVLYDSSTQDYDTISVVESFGQHQNYFEGSKLKYTNYYYRGAWHQSNSDYTFRIEYNTLWSHPINNQQVHRIEIYGKKTSYDVLFYSNMAVNELLIGGSEYVSGNKVRSYFILTNNSDSCYVMGQWVVEPTVNYSILNSTVFGFQDIEFMFLKNTGIVSHNINGNYILVDKYVVPKKE